MTTKIQSTSKGGAVAPEGVRFEEADKVLLGEARARFDREEGLNNTYQGKTGLFLAFSGFFSAMLGAPLGNLLDAKNWSGRWLQWAALLTLLVALLCLLWAIWTLLESSISDKYETVAAPKEWREYLERLRAAVVASVGLGVEERAILEANLLEAWQEAADHCIEANKAKARFLKRASRALQPVVIVGGLGLLLFVAQAVTK